MPYNKINPELLVKHTRDGLIEQSHYGFIVLTNKNKPFDFTGEDKGYPFFIRSCAKPLQASLIIDYGIDEVYNLTQEEIALSCASHSGEKLHVDIAKKYLKKIGLKEKDLKCGLHKPISKKEQDVLIAKNKKETVFQNNCIGKHIMMLAICKHKGWDLATYDEANHPLQIEIKKKINELCHIKKDYPLTKDGCGVPIVSMPLKNLVQGYINLFSDVKYAKIKNAFLDNPKVIGGEDRLDTKVMECSRNLLAKVGASGLCIVMNLEKEEAFIVKICDSDMKAREIVVADVLKNLNWGSFETDKDIKTLHNEVIGKITTSFD
ncbi:MAG: asparaginase [Candidatus Gastranaerophilales bacterium]